MGNRARIMSMDVLPIAVCMFLCMSYLTPGYAQAQRTCQECIVILYQTNFGRLTQGNVRNLLHRTNLAHSRDIESIEILSELNMAIITLFNPRVAARIAQRQTINFRGKAISVELNRVVAYIDDK